MNRQPGKIIAKLIGIIILIAITIFSYFKYQPMIQGPTLSEISLDEWTITDQSSIRVTGTVKNTQNININGRSLTLNELNTFNETVALNTGSNNIYIDLIDIFGGEKSYTYHVYAEYTFPEFTKTYNEAIKIKADAEAIEDGDGIEPETAL